MRVNIRVKANAKEERIEKLSTGDFIVCVRQPAHEGKANAGVIKLLSEYFGVPKSLINIIKGLKAKNKVVEVPGGKLIQTQ